jgi:hypothetical protein
MAAVQKFWGYNQQNKPIQKQYKISKYLIKMKYPNNTNISVGIQNYEMKK